MKTSILALSAFAALSSAHATWQQLWVNGVDQQQKCVYLPQSNSPVTNVQSNDIRCNVSPKKPTAACSVAAGQTVTVEMHQQNNDRSCSTEAIGGNHKGPVIVYISKVNDALNADGSTPWVKIFESGLVDAATQKYGNDVLNDNCGKQVVKIPSNLAPGQYLLRAETIALHAAGQTGGAQFYISCFALNVTGGGSANPSGVSLPGAYSANDPGILISIWYPVPQTYKVPGPAVWSG